MAMLRINRKPKKHTLKEAVINVRTGCSVDAAVEGLLEVSEAMKKLNEEALARSAVKAAKEVTRLYGWTIKETKNGVHLIDKKGQHKATIKYKGYGTVITLPDEDYELDKGQGTLVSGLEWVLEHHFHAMKLRVLK